MTLQSSATARTATLLLLALGLVAAGCKQKPTDAEMKANAKRQADAMGAANLNRDFGAAVSFMYDEVVTAMGGKERVIRTMHQADAKMSADGFALRKVTMGDPTDLTESKGQRFAIVPESIEMSAPGGGRLKTNGFLLAISNDAGVTWKFLDGAGIADAGENLYTLLPNLPRSLKLPAKREPVLVPGE